MNLVKAMSVAILSLFAVAATTVPTVMAQDGKAKTAKTAKKAKPAKTASKAKPAKKMAKACKGEFMFKDKKSGKCTDARNKKG